MPASDSLVSYLSLISPVHQEKPRFMALASAVLSQAADLLALYGPALAEAFSPDTATGAQLDAIGQLTALPRPAPDTPDEDYRAYLRAGICLHRWDGRNESLPALLAAAFPDQNARLIDNQDGTVTASLEGAFPCPLREVFPRPAGIRLTEG